MKHKKIIYIFLSFIAIMALGAFSPGVAFAQQVTSLSQTPNWWSCVGSTGSPVTCSVFFVSSLLNSALALLISLGALLLTYFLELNASIFNSPANAPSLVQVGFSASLSIANLGFVFGIIVIALATIIRNETYGMKQILWKLVAMAILVNFGLVITSPIMSFSDNFTQFFVQKSGGTDTAFVTNITNAFAPQQLINPVSTTNTAANGAVSSAVSTAADWLSSISCSVDPVQCLAHSAAGSVAGALTPSNNTTANSPSANTSGDTFIRQVLSLIFSSIFLAIIAFTMITVAILLLVRYVYISLLLVLLPLAWLTWIFPSFKSNFTKWWSLFLKWTFFPAITLFFIYLALTIAPGAGGTYLATAMAPAGQTGNTFGQVSLAQTILDQLVLTFLVLGGLFAANSLSLTGASAIIGAGRSAAGAVTGYVGRKTKVGAGYARDQAKRGATYPLRTEAGRRATERLQTLGLNNGAVGRALTRPLREVGGLVAKVRQSGEKPLAEQHKKFDKLSLEEQARNIGTTDDYGKAAIMQNLQKAMKSTDTKTRSAATKAWNSLPADIQSKFDKLKLLYGKGGKNMPETFVEGGGFKSKKALEDAIKKVQNDGGDTTDLEHLLDEIKEAEEKQTQAVKESSEIAYNREARDIAGPGKNQTTTNVQAKVVLIDNQASERNVRSTTRFDAGGKPIKET